jgi:hypothetical protein
MVYRAKSEKRRQRLWWSFLLGAPLLIGLGVGVLALASFFRNDDVEIRSPAAESTDIAGARVSADGTGLEPGGEEPELPPGPPGAPGVESRAAPQIAPPAPVGANRFPKDPAPLLSKPDAVRGIYLNAWAAGSSRRRAQLIELAEKTEINTFVIDVKEGGEISYRSGVALARAIGADRSYIPNPRRMLEELREAGIYTIARIVVFKDPVLADQRPAWAIQEEDGSLWRDNNAGLWVDPYNREVWDYNIAIAREAVLLGFSEVQWDYVRFPDVPARFMQTARYPSRAGRSRTDAIREFLLYSREELADLGVQVTADVFGLTVSVRNDMGIGQSWEEMADVTDALLPMIYPSHFAKGSYGIPSPNADPYRTVKTALDYAVRRSSKIAGSAAIRPWLQDFTLGRPSYGAEEVRAQIQATYDAGLTEWILWNPGSRYTEGALASRSGVPPAFALPDHDMTPTGDTVQAPRSTRAPLLTPLGVPVRLDSIKPD